MKPLKYIYLSALLIASYGCSDNLEIVDFQGDKVAFSYQVTGDYSEDFYIGSTIQFSNISEASGACVWDFGDGQTSTEMNPQHKFQKSGTYKVSLTIEGEGKRERNLLISDIFPVLSVDCSDPVCEVLASQVELDVFLPNPEELKVDYEWVFPEGTLNADGQEMISYKGENPGKLTFTNIGSQKIVLKTKLNDRPLEEGFVNVQVGYNKDVKTIYYAVANGNLMAYKLINDAPANMKIKPFDLGIKSGSTPMNLLCDDSLVYILDAGKQMKYIDDTDGTMGDGKLSVVSKDGKTVETLFTNDGGHAYNDPFYGYLDKTTRSIYVADRNTGISRFSADDRNLQMNREKYGYFVQNNRLLYYNVGYQYGAINACFTKAAGVWYWCKTFNGTGVFRFKDTDIQTAEVKQGVADKPYPVLLSGCYVKSIAIDDKNELAYFVIRVGSGPTPGLYVTKLSTFEGLKSVNDVVAAEKAGSCILVANFESDDLGSSGEYIDVCQMTLDSETGAVYFGYRAGTNSTYASGLYKCLVKNPGTLSKGNITFEPVITGVQIFGVTINNNKSKLF
ncbi:MAG: PKD domain-containing protein [Bacteroidales bacterium]